MRSSVKSLIHKSSRNAITWAEPILKVLVLVFAFAAWGLRFEAWLNQHIVSSRAAKSQNMSCVCIFWYKAET